MSDVLEESPKQYFVDEQYKQENYSHAVSWLIVWAALAFATLLGFARLSYGLLLPALQSELGASLSVLGAIATVNFFGGLLGTLIVPVLLKYIQKPVITNFIFLIITNILMIASASSFSIWQLGLWRLLIGFFSAAASVLTMTLTLEQISPRESGLASGLMWTGVAFGLVFSGILAPLTISGGFYGGWRLIWIIMGLVGIVAAVGFFVTIRSSLRTHSRTQQKQAVAESGIKQRTFWATQRPLFLPQRLLGLTVVFFSFGAGYIIYFTFFIALLERQGVPALDAGFVWAAIGITGAISSAVWGKILDRWPTGFILSLPLVLGVCGSLTVLTNVLAVEAGGAALVGLSAFLAPALMVATLLKRAVPSEDYAVNYSLLTAIFGVGQILGPLVGGEVIEWFSLPAGIATSALLFGVAALAACGYGLAQRKQKTTLPGDFTSYGS